MAKKPRILCVDDKLPNLRVRTALLEQFGCETVAAADHQSALQVVKETVVDLIVIDYHLANDETGDAIARDVRAAHPEIPIIMLTGDPRLPSHVALCVDAVLLKGTSNPTTLLDLIETLVPGATLRPRRPMIVPKPPSGS